jgi:phosphotransferase system  glucose/maltose/N-acetylglucosamine-specific IIC component
VRDLNWRSAFRKATIFTILWLGLVYIIDRISPGLFGLESREQWIPLLINGVFFFFLYAVLFAWLEKRRDARLAKVKEQKKREKQAEAEEREPGELKGVPNPNTSKRKVRRKRR